MVEIRRKNWRELCRAALDAKDPDKLLQIVQELSRVLKSEEQVRRDFRNTLKVSGSAGTSHDTSDDDVKASSTPAAA
jgi:hypothetical protein